jgi:hypothetical protein
MYIDLHITARVYFSGHFENEVPNSNLHLRNIRSCSLRLDCVMQYFPFKSGTEARRTAMVQCD